MRHLEEQVLTYLDDNRNRLYELLSKLVKIDSQNYITHGDEVNCRELILSEYRRLGLEAEEYCPDNVPGIKECPGYLAGRGTDKRPNFCGTYRVQNPAKCIMLAAHTDTMPIGERELWRVEPLGGEIRDGRIYGRGSGDNKFGIASSVMAMEALIKCGIQLESDIILEAYCDEEYGGGNGALAASLRNRCDTIVNTDGGNYEIWSCSMGGQGLGIKITAREPQDSAALVIDGLQIVREELEGFFNNRYGELAEDRYFAGTDMQRSAVRIHEFKAGNNACDLDFGNLNFVYYSNKPEEELHNEIAEAEKRIRSRLKDMGIETEGFKPTTRFFHCLSLPDENTMLQTLKKAAEQACGHEIKISGACMSDLSIFLKFGTPNSVNFGILRDFKLYGGAHQPDEFVNQEEFLNHCKALALFLIRWGGAHQSEN